MPARDLFHQRQSGFRSGAPGGLGHATVNRQPVTILHQHVSGVAELGLLARALAGQPRLGIGGGLVSGIGARFAVEVDAGVAGIVRRGLPLSGIALEALMPRPRLDQGAVDREVLVGEQVTLACLAQHRSEEPPLGCELSSCNLVVALISLAQ